MKTTLIGVVFAAAAAMAGDGTWIGTGTGLTWSDTANWQSGTVGGGTDGGLVTFANTADATIALTGPISFHNAHMIGESATFEGGSVNFVGSGTNVFNIALWPRSLTFNTSVSGSNGFIKRGAGSLRLNMPNPALTGGITLEGGMIAMDQMQYGQTTTGVNFLPRQDFTVTAGPSYLRFNPAANGAYQQFANLKINAPLIVEAAATSGTMVLWPGALAGAAPMTVATEARLKVEASVNYRGELTLTNTARLFMCGHNPVENYISGVCTNGLVFHMDANALDTMTLNGDEVTAWGETQARRNICAWNGVETIVATPAGATHPKLLRNELNGHSVVDLGPAVDDGGMAWSRAVENIRTVIMVVGSQNGGGTLLGANGPLANYRFWRGCDLMASKGDPRISSSPVYTAPVTRNHALFRAEYCDSGCGLRINGTTVDGQMSSPLSGGYDIVTFRMPRNGSAVAAASAFSRVADGTFARTGAEGGQRIAEVLAFSGYLEDTTCAKLEHYLSLKWFNRKLPGWDSAYVDRVCDATSHETATTYAFNLPGDRVAGNCIHVDVFRQLPIGNYFSVADVTLNFGRADWRKKIRLMGNSKVEMTARQVSTTCPVPGAALHVAADQRVETDGSGNVLRMAGIDGACGALTNRLGAGEKPVLVANALNGKPVIDFGANASGKHLVWQSNVIVRAAFFVMQVTNPRNTFLGSVCPEMTVIDHFTRWDNTKNTIYGKGVQKGALSGRCRMDDVRVLDPVNEEFPSDRFVVFGQTFEGAQMANAFGCGALQSTNLRAERTGGLKIAEAIIYDRSLTEEESLAVQAYLRYKWFNVLNVGYAAPGQPYTIPGLGAGSSASVNIAGTAPVKVNELFGGQTLTLTAPETVVKIPAPQGTLVLRNAAVDLTANVAAGKITAQAGTTNLVTGTGTLAALTVNGGFDLRGGASTNVSALTFAAGSALLLGTGELETHTLALGAGVEIASTVSADHSCGTARTCDLSVAGSGSVTLTLDPSVVADPCGVYPLVTFGSLAAEDAARFAQGTLRVVPALEASYVTRLRVVNNALCASISKTGITIIVR